MEISKLNPAPAVPAASAPGVGSSAARGPGAGVVAPAAPAERTAQTLPETGAPAADAGIRSLDLASALKILIAEVRLALIDAQIAGGAGGSAAPSRASGASGASPASTIAGVVLPPEESLSQAARALVDLLLGFTPAQEMPAEALERAIVGLRQVMDTAAQSAIERVAAWRDTQPSLADGLRQAQARAAAAITAGIADETPPGLLMRPEWLGLGPRLAQLRRRLRRRRLLLTDRDADHLDAEPDTGPDADKR